VPTLRVEQIKKTKTIRRAYMCDNEGVYRRLCTAKNAGKQLSTRIFCGTGFYKRQEKKKDDPSLAIGEKIKSKKRKYILLLNLSLIVFVS